MRTQTGLNRLTLATLALVCGGYGYAALGVIGTHGNPVPLFLSVAVTSVILRRR